MKGNEGQKSRSAAFTDERDGQVYKTVQIGEQVWLAQNLNFDMDGSYCCDDNPVNAAKYGLFYTWEAAKIACPPGWHLPDNEEWDRLKSYVEAHNGNESVGISLKSTSGWNGDGNGSDRFGFSALPAGETCWCSGDACWHSASLIDDLGSDEGLVFCSWGRVASFWSASEYDGDCACNRNLSYYGDDLSAYHNYKCAASSVRLVKDSD